jgi:hypothetical protein
VSRKYLVIETFFKETKQNFYYLMLPDVRDDGFYRAATSYNAFFNSIKKPKANVTDVRQFTSDDELGIEIRKKHEPRSIDWDNLQTFASIWEFYKFIGYDYKSRKYKSGEKNRQ